jgi:phenylalanyl-tRNA synthetase alpha chain
MSLQDFCRQLDELAEEASTAFEGAQELPVLEEARVEFLGAKNGRLKSVQKLMGSVAKEDKPQAGQKLNQVKSAIQDGFESAKKRLVAGGGERLVDPTFDPSLPGYARRLGRLHPISQTINELTNIMGRLGFSLAVGPEIEDEHHNFNALNIPNDHPARDPLENFYLAPEAGRMKQLLLRSQTSTVQVRVMDKTPPPIRIISLGRVYRPDTADATHYPMFHQMEGLMVDQAVTMADLKSTLRMFATSYLGDEVSIRFRPSFFPFTEPSVEVDFYWNGQWMEFGGAGMVDPNVLSAVGYDPEQVTGFAFGLGVERLCMRRYGILDIRDLFTNDVRFLRQF